MNQTDVLIITALQEEYEAARDAALAGNGAHPGVAEWESRDLGNRTPYLFGTFLTSDHQRFSIALARPTRMGPLATSTVVSTLVERLKPRCLAMCGVCAGNPAAVALGDVIVAEFAYSFDEGKKTGHEFEGDHRQFPAPDTWVRQAQELQEADLPSYGKASDDDAKLWLLERLRAGEVPTNHPACLRYFPGTTWRSRLKRWQAEGLITRNGASLGITEAGRALVEAAVFDELHGPSRLPFQIVVGPMASGNMVVTDGLTWDQLKKLGVRSVVGLEMEAATIGGAAHRLGVSRWVVAKGVMDHADGRKADRYKRFAARASAEVLIKLLTSQLAAETSVSQSGEAPSGWQHSALELAKAPDSADAPKRSSLPGTADFVGRSSELSRLRRRIDTHDPAGAVVSIHAVDGMAGIGKTTLALHLAHEYKAKYPDEALFVDLHGYTLGVTPLAAFDAAAELLRQAGIPESAIHPDLPARLTQWHSVMAGRRSVVVLDNALDVTQVAPLLPLSASCLTLITSRSRLIGLPGATPFSLDVMSPADATSLFVHLVGTDRCHDTATTARVISLVGGLPLAIEIIAGRLRGEQTMTMADLEVDLSDRRLNETSTREAGVRIALDVSIQRLNAEEKQAFYTIGLHPGPSVGVPQLAALAAIPEKSADDALRVLHERNLIRLSTPRIGHRRYELHDLVREYAHEQAENHFGPPERAAAADRLITWYRDALRVKDWWKADTDPKIDNAAAAVRLRLTEPADARSWLVAEIANLISIVKRGNTVETAEICLVAGFRLRVLGYVGAAFQLASRALELAQRFNDRLQEAEAFFELGECSRANLDSEKAEEYLQAALIVGAQLPSWSGEPTALCGLGHISRGKTDFAEAKTYFEQALSVSMARDDGFGVASAYFGLAETALDEAKPRSASADRTQLFSIAETHLQRALKYCQDNGDGWGESSVWALLGAVAWSQGNHVIAGANLASALTIKRDIGEISGQAQVNANLGAMAWHDRDLSRAHDHYLAALAAFREIRDWRGEADTLRLLSAIATRQGRHLEATELSSEAATVYGRHHHAGDGWASDWSQNVFHQELISRPLRAPTGFA